jgi:hypothetical protein
MTDRARDIFGLIDNEYRKELQLKTNRVRSKHGNVEYGKTMSDEDIQNILTSKFRETINNDNAKNKNPKGEQVGDFFITEDFGVKERLEKINKKRKKNEKNRQRLYKLLAKKEFILKKLASINITKKKHIDEVADLNYKLEMIDWELNKIKEESGFDHIKIQRGTKIQHLMAYVAKKFKKIKKFFSKDWVLSIRNIIIGAGIALVPRLLVGFLVKKMKQASSIS